MDSLADILRPADFADSADRDAVLDDVSRALFSTPAPPPVVGRYRVLGRLGRGGQGVVYAAEDPRLGRRVAIKILRVGGAGPEAIQRLRREATALARLSHPNVIAINDVGTFACGVFIVMQLVEGETLSAWLGTRRSSTEILTAFDGAGRGLAAAHAHGIVHRDFKPTNVWMGNDGVVRLLDFGLARLGAAAESGSSCEPATDPEMRLTGVGHVMGTPAYMAPEQHDGASVDPSTDQYAFCVALFEALYGVRPFAGATLAELHEAKLGSSLPSPPSDRVVSPAIRRVVARGLHPDAARRWPDMQALLTALAAAASPTRTRRVSGILALLAVSLGTSSWLDAAAQTPECAAEHAMAQIWSPSRRAELATALDRSDLPFAKDMAARVVGDVDDFVRAWGAARGEACAAVDGDASRDRRLACLDGLRNELEDRLGILDRAELGVVEHADELVRDLAAPTSCSEAKYAASDPRFDEVRRAIGHAHALGVAGRVDAAVDAARDAAASADATHDDALGAQAAVAYGDALLDTGSIAEAADMLETGYLRATAAGDDRVAFEAALQLVDLFASTRQDPKRCGEWLQRADASLLRSQDASDDIARGRLALAHAKRKFSAGDIVNAVDHAREAAELLEGADDLRTTAALDTLAKLTANSGHADDAYEIAGRNVAVAERLRGPHHPATASALETLATMTATRGDVEAALELLERALAIRIDVFGDDDLRVAEAMRNIATTHARAGHDEDAVHGYRTVLAIQRRHLPADDTKIAQTLYNLSLPLRSLGELEEAGTAGREALRIAEASIGPDHPTTAIYLHGLGETTMRTSPRAALVMFERGQTIVRRALGEHHELVATFAASIEAARARVRIESPRPREATR